MCEHRNLERDIPINLKCPFTVAAIFGRACERQGNGDFPNSSTDNCFQSSRLLGFEVLDRRKLLSRSMREECIFLARLWKWNQTSSNVMKLCNVIYHIGSYQSSVSSKLSDSARAATKWYDFNLLAGNLKKYQTMNIGNSQAVNSSAPAIRVNNEEIKNVENLRLLGVTFTEDISTICKKASQRIGVLMQIQVSLWRRHFQIEVFQKNLQSTELTVYLIVRSRRDVEFSLLAYIVAYFLFFIVVMVISI